MSTSKDIAEAVVRREHPEAGPLYWLPVGSEYGALLQLVYTAEDGHLEPSGVMCPPWTVPTSVRRVIR